MDPLTLAISTIAADTFGQLMQSFNQSAQNRRNTNVINRNYETNLQLLFNDASMRRQEIGQTLFNQNISGARARSDTVSTMASQGIHGLSVNAILNNITNQQTYDRNQTLGIEEYRTMQDQYRATGFDLDRQGAINNLPTPANPFVIAGGAGLRIASKQAEFKQ